MSLFSAQSPTRLRASSSGPALTQMVAMPMIPLEAEASPVAGAVGAAVNSDGKEIKRDDRLVRQESITDAQFRSQG